MKEAPESATLEYAYPQINLDGPWHENICTILQALLKRRLVYQSGGELRFLTQSGLTTPCKEQLTDLLDRIAGFYRVTQRGTERFVRCPLEFANRLLAASHAWCMESVPEIDGVLHYPVMRPDGEIIKTRGLDTSTRLLCLVRTAYEIPETPSLDNVRAALATLWKPVSRFPYAAPEDAGATLALLLSAVERPVLPTCPAFIIAAPTYAAGKTALGQVAGILAGGSDKVVSAPASHSEMHKFVLSTLRGNPSHILIDNLSGTLRGDALAAVMTTKEYEGRVLGSTRMITVKNRALWICTGVNISAAEDLVRRVITITIDPAMENPEGRSFNFHPVILARETQGAMRQSALTVLRAAHLAGASNLQASSVGSFEEWNQMVRKAVLWLIKEGLTPCDMADPMLTQIRARQEDPETERLRTILTGWRALGEGQPHTISEMLDVARCTYAGENKEVAKLLVETLYELGGAERMFAPRKAAWHLKHWAGRHLDGLCLEQDTQRSNLGQRWRVRVSGKSALPTQRSDSHADNPPY